MRVLVVDGFTEPDAVSAGTNEVFEANGHRVTTIVLRDEGFDSFMSAAEREAYHSDAPLITNETRRSADLVRSCDALVVATPLNHGAIEPRVKSWFERVFVPGVSFTFNDAGRVTAALTNIRRVAMVARGLDNADSAHHRNGSSRSVLRAVRLNCHRLCRTSYVALDPAEPPEPKLERAFRRW